MGEKLPSRTGVCADNHCHYTPDITLRSYKSFLLFGFRNEIKLTSLTCEYERPSLFAHEEIDFPLDKNLVWAHCRRHDVGGAFPAHSFPFVVLFLLPQV
jgi:hypothetical protein